LTNGEDVIEERSTPVRAALVQAEQPETEQRNLLAAASLNSFEKRIFKLRRLRSRGILMTSLNDPT
jgi:hypothetical protein